MLATRFGRHSPVLRSVNPLTNDQIRNVAPSIFATEAHESRSERYTYIPTIQVLDGLRGQGFEPFMVAQTRVRDEGKREHTKHMLRLRHASQINDTEANEVILLNSHDGTSSYQMLTGFFRFVCANGLVVGDASEDIRIRHKGEIVDEVIESAFQVLNGFGEVRQRRDEMRQVELSTEEATIFARASLALKYDPTDAAPAPVTEAQILAPRRMADDNNNLWTVMNRVQENLVRGGLEGRASNGRRRRTRGIEGIDQSVKVNRALWLLTEEMRKLKA